MPRDRYRAASTWYDWLIEPGLRGFKDAAAALRAVRPGMRVLDIGCGTGTFLQRFDRPGVSLVGVDASAAMLARARRRLGPSADLELATAAELPFDDGRFDLVTATMVLHELLPAVRERAIAEALRVMRADGELLVLDYSGRSRRAFMGRLESSIIRLVEWTAGGDHYAGFCDFLRHGAVHGTMAPFPLELVEEQSLSEGGFVACVFRHAASGASSTRPLRPSRSTDPTAIA